MRRCRRARRNVTPVVCHVRLDEMTGAQRTVERQLTGQDTGGNDTSELPGVVTGRCWVSAAYAKEIEHGGLGLEDGTAADGTDFD